MGLVNSRSAVGEDLLTPFFQNDTELTRNGNILTNALLQLGSRNGSVKGVKSVKYIKMPRDELDQSAESVHIANASVEHSARDMTSTHTAAEQLSKTTYPRMNGGVEYGAVHRDSTPSCSRSRAHQKCPTVLIDKVWRRLMLCHRRGDQSKPLHSRLQRSDSDVSSLPREARPSSKPRSSENCLDRVSTLQPSNHLPHPTYGSVHRSPAPHHSSLQTQLHSELAQYIESMNELSSLKTQLGTISRLSPYTHRRPIASETLQLPPHLQTAMFPTKSVQTEHQQDLASDIHEAQVQIIELTKMLQAKDAVLRQREQENARLVDAVNRLREALEHTGIQVNSHSAVDNHQSHYTPSLNTRRATERSPAYSHSYDPRHFSSGVQNTSNASHRQGSSSLTRIGYPLNTRLQQAVPGAPKTEATHVKQMSMNVNRNQAGFYGEDIYVPVERY
ncbi:hypothetical protein CSKR_103245 [Clonorchis sinensis]|uniref:Uncharacterized protein n=1 Tax=Clonorchis sinensis TaxID=79923 RepID=A0A8T1LV68_CLOSI|nr:hypothetical protein CSKR_103245 [Clonorchis sinensis]